MIGGEPKVGYVLRYAYLWKYDYDRGLEEGEKERPCVLVVSVSNYDENNRKWVRVLPITHTEPIVSSAAFEIPPMTKTRLGLDSERSWVVLTEGNTFVWPGPDLRPVPGREPSTIYYGPLPPRLFRAIVNRLLVLAKERRLQSVPRSS